jgi:hypothetical protein
VQIAHCTSVGRPGSSALVVSIFVVIVFFVLVLVILVLVLILFFPPDNHKRTQAIHLVHIRLLQPDKAIPASAANTCSHNKQQQQRNHSKQAKLVIVRLFAVLYYIYQLIVDQFFQSASSCRGCDGCFHATAAAERNIKHTAFFILILLHFIHYY